MKIDVGVELYDDKIGYLVKASKKAFQMTVEAVFTDIKTSQAVPKDTGALEDSGFTKTNVEGMVARIVFDTPYARRLYWHPEYNFRTDKNPNAGGMWMQPYLDGSKKNFVRETYMAFLRELSGGLIR